MDYFLTPHTRKERFPYFKILLIASVVYAMLFTFCRYKSGRGITVFVNYVVTLGYLFYLLKAFGLKIKKGFIFTAVIYLLLGLNIFQTADVTVIFFDRIGGSLVLLCGLLHQFYNDKDWGFGKYFTALNQLFFCSFGHVADPYIDASHREKTKANSNFKYIIFGLLAVIPVAALVIWLLTSADLMFSKFFGDFFENIHINDILLIILMAFTAFTASYALIRKLSFHDINETVEEKRYLNPIVGISFNSVLTVIYLIFSVFQFVFLFFRAGLPEGYTYAEYAHEGFYQLVAVSILNIVIVFVSKVIFGKNKVLNIILTITSLCTFVMIASSFYRIILYIGAYQLSMLRILTVWALTVITLIMAAVCIYIYCPKFPVTRAIVIIVSCLYVIFAYSHPSIIISTYNMNAYLETGEGDLEYIATLDESADAFIYADEYIASHPHDDVSKWSEADINECKISYAQNTYILNDVNYGPVDNNLFSFRKFNIYHSKAQKYINSNIKTLIPQSPNVGD